MATGIHQRDRRLVADGPVRPILVVESAPSLQLFAGVGKRQEPVGVQAFRSEASVEGLDEGVIGGRAGSGEDRRLGLWCALFAPVSVYGFSILPQSFPSVRSEKFCG